MEPMEIARRVQHEFAQDVRAVSEFRDQVTVEIARERVLSICRFLRETPAISMDLLTDLCGVDHPGDWIRFRVVYHLHSVGQNHRIRLKALVPEREPVIDSVVSIWNTANWYERETYDMFGIVFKGHPNLSRILMTEDWQGHPLRKDYPLEGPDNWEYPAFEHVKKLHERDDEWGMK